MIKNLLLFTALLFCFIPLYAQEQALKSMETPWSDKVGQQPHQEYPRPQMSRENWVNLNGKWQYTIQDKSPAIPEKFDGEILVPFAVESKLSGVGRIVGDEKYLWYKRTFDVSPKMRSGKLLLHFGAVDWEAEVFINGQSVGMHQGGYDPFYFEINDYLVKNREQEVVVRVWDPSDNGPQPRGKQVEKPNSIWYTPVTGIWQTVWMEAVPSRYISSTKNTPDFDQNKISILPHVAGNPGNGNIEVKVMDNGRMVGQKTVKIGETADFVIDSPKHWSPSSPFLYDVEVSLKEGNKVIDKVKTYTALRKINMGTDQNGVQRMLLNNEFLFQYGPLDQGWWPDGLYTAPNEAALVFDIQKTRDMGFNMIRKHVKVEPARWYYHCDRMGMLVWQDMPNGDHGNRWEQRPGIVGLGTEKDRTAASEQIFRKEWKAIMDANYNFPSIVVWVPFNEAWGQFKTTEITEWTQQYDPTRLINSASGGNFIMKGSKITGHVIDLHNYPDAAMPDPELYGKDQVIVLGEFGGLGLPVEGHTWQQKDNWGYQSFQNKEALEKRYTELIEALLPLIQKGLSAAVYTQTTDVEIEINGLMTYDRKVVKLNVEHLNKIHQRLYQIKLK
ncbi:glycoside hydrolase family 2 protein [Anditalea andensis]|uniref:Beta-galactosidase n=1 Tax=Anditalea andensis TaxID=1048983 RepID=A0A074KWD4_9BACT|nr:sugar-binding domain-containing protein [Anditalea andensis]KEO71923.1 beta-galactosidase [Anditalea andensis]